MTRMKKLLALCLGIIMIISSLPMISWAEEPTVIKWKAGYRKGTSATGDLYEGYADIPYKVLNATTGAEMTYGNVGADNGGSFSLKSTAHSLNYVVTVEDSGVYEFEIEVGRDGTKQEDTLHVYVDNEEVNSFYVDNTALSFVHVSYVPMTAGVPVTFTLKNLPADINVSGEYAGFVKINDMMLTSVPPLTFTTIEDGVTLGRSTDVITLDYSRELDEDELKNATITLGDLAVSAELDGADASKLNIILNESLSYDTDYTLTVSGVTDVVGYITGEETINFKTAPQAEDESLDNSTAAITVEVADTTFIVSGNVYGSLGQPIAGRNVEISVTTPLENDTKVIDTLTSDENGSFELIYELPEDYLSVGGEYIFTAVAEYVELPVTSGERYISEDDRIILLGNLEDAVTAGDVETFFGMGTNAVDLGADLSSLSSLDNESLFYDRLAKASYKNDDGKYDLAVFEKVWKIAYALESIKQSGDDSITETYLDDADFASAIGLDAERYALLDTQKSAFASAVTALDRQETAEDFGKEVNALINEYLLKENDKTDLTLTLSDDSVYVGQIAKVALSLTEEAEDVSEYTIKVTCPSKDSANKVSLTAPKGATAAKSTDGSVASFTVTEVSGKLESLGTLEYSSSSAVSEEFTVSGTAVYDIEGLVLDCNIISDETTITVKANSNKGGSGSTTGRVSVGGGSKTPVISTPEEKQEGFTDLSDAAWAEPYITSLTKSGIISIPADGKFRPNDSITRAEFVKMLVSALRLTAKDVNIKLNDVSPSDWYYQAVSAAVSYGLVLGDDNGNFCPNDTITRQDMCVIMSRAMDKLGYGKVGIGELFYDDHQISSYAREAVYRMRHHGIVNGVGDGTFAPLSDASRAVTAKIIDTFMKEANI